MGSHNRTKAFFILVILLMIGLGGFSLFYLDQISKKMELLYKHPYTVSNAVRNIDKNIVSMHRYMKDVALAENMNDIALASSHVDMHEVMVLKNFETVFDRYLGAKSDINSAYQAFIDWKVIRDEVIRLKISGNDKQAAQITTGKGAEHVELLTIATKELIDFADNKAEFFLNDSRKFRAESFAYITSLLLIAILISSFLSFYTIRSLVRARDEIHLRMNLIDQNILMAEMNREGEIEEISNHLCRLLNVTKGEIIGNNPNFFINPEVSNVSTKDIETLTASGVAWSGEIELIDGHGDHCWIQSTVHPNFNDNRLIGYTNIIQDITSKKEIEVISLTDSLTKLNNRRHFDVVIDKEIKIARRNRKSIVFAMIDIDFFKKYNDHYGHAEGDSALIKVASIFKGHLRRPNDYAFRLGGEEFGLIFSDCQKEDCLKILENIRENIEALGIKHSKSEVSSFITVSIGAVVDANNIYDSSQLYIKADEQLYQAKTCRNSVCVT